MYSRNEQMKNKSEIYVEKKKVNEYYNKISKTNKNHKPFKGQNMLVVYCNM